MPFPEVDRVIFHKNPLQEVVCQLRFPPILKIDANIPDEFQEDIRIEFPNYSETSEFAVEVPEGIPAEILRQFMQTSGTKNYEFLSEDGTWKVNLTRTFLALSTRKYHRWEEFRERLVKPLTSLKDHYSPPYFTRVGLRYINVIKRSELSLPGVEWDKLLKPYILGVLASPGVGSAVGEFQNVYMISLSDERSKVKLVTKFAKDTLDDEICFLIDSDFHNTDRTGVDAVLHRLNYLNSRSTRLIQWAIEDELFHAMEPEKL